MTRTPSKHEAKFLRLWEEAGGPVLTEEHRFHPTRMWRFDFALPESLVGIEIEGATWAGGRHTRGSGYAKDCEKYNAAAELGWMVFRLTAQMVTPEWVERIINKCAPK